MRTPKLHPWSKLKYGISISSDCCFRTQDRMHLEASANICSCEINYVLLEVLCEDEIDPRNSNPTNMRLIIT